jgi:hypothetical protein
VNDQPTPTTSDYHDAADRAVAARKRLRDRQTALEGAIATLTANQTVEEELPTDGSSPSSSDADRLAALTAAVITFAQDDSCCDECLRARNGSDAFNRLLDAVDYPRDLADAG